MEMGCWPMMSRFLELIDSISRLIFGMIISLIRWYSSHLISHTPDNEEWIGTFGMRLSQLDLKFLLHTQDDEFYHKMIIAHAKWMNS